MIFRRRTFIQTGIALGASFLYDSWRPIPAADACSPTRFSATSNEGKAMLAIYADAVGKMMDASKFPQSDPRSWLFQWYTHSVPRGQKAAELNRVFPSGQPAALRQLADQMWETCQAHHPGDREDFFLPWHRMYVACFEEIIRFVSGKACFTLPYWDYTNPAERSLPQEFRQKGDSKWGPLYRESRWASVNGGGDVTQSEGGGDLNLNCMQLPTYSGTSGVAGFCGSLDNAPHGALHVDVGDDQGMAQVPWAANDPIFWLHHCNVDRIWASWNRAGGKNPNDAGFRNAHFTFALPSGGAVTPFVRDVLSVPLDSYDSYLLPRPQGSVPFPVGNASGAELLSVHADSSPQTSAPVKLNSGPVTVTLATQRATAPHAPSDVRFSAQLNSLDKAAPVYLALNGLAASGPVQGVFDIYVHGKDNPKLDKAAPAHVGQINFFASTAMPGSAPAAGTGPSASFVLSSETRDYLQKLGTDEPQVTFVPTGNVADSAAPSVARVRLLAS